MYIGVKPMMIFRTTLALLAIYFHVVGAVLNQCLYKYWYVNTGDTWAFQHGPAGDDGVVIMW